MHGELTMNEPSAVHEDSSRAEQPSTSIGLSRDFNQPQNRRNQSMTTWPGMFKTSTALLLVHRGYGVLVKGDLIGDQHVGRCLFRELTKGHEWLYIGRIRHLHNQVEIEVLEVKTLQDKGTEDGVTTDITEHHVTSHTLTFDHEDEILLFSKPPGPRPQARRIIACDSQVLREEPLGEQALLVL
jgi:hypothetical protein